MTTIGVGVVVGSEEAACSMSLAGCRRGLLQVTKRIRACTTKYGVRSAGPGEVVI